MLGKAAIAAIFSTILFLGVTFGQQTKQATKTNSDTLSYADRGFINSAEEGNLAEIESAKIVEQKATDPAVKDFASRMVTDHTQASQGLKALAKSSGVTLPAEPTAAQANQKDEWQKLSGAKLDDAYLRVQLEDHKQAISVFENEIEHGQNEAVKDYAEKTLPTLQDHIRIAEDIAGKIGMSGKAGLTQENKAIPAK
jgi:putative membrane protein